MGIRIRFHNNFPQKESFEKYIFDGGNKYKTVYIICI